MSKYDAQIERIKQKMAAQDYPLEPCSESYVVDFEQTYGIRLPEEFRRFLLEVGGYYLFLPETPQSDASPFYSYDRTYAAIMQTRLNNLHKPFPFKGAWIWEGEVRDDEWAKKAEQLKNGNLLLGDFGCAMYAHLIITGAERGKVWDFVDVGICSTELYFLDWVECLLDGINPYDLFCEFPPR